MSLFGNTGLFGNNNNQQNQNGGLFGNKQQGQSGGLFGNTNQQGQSGSLFGNTNQQGQSGGLFGNTNQQGQSGGLFGNTNQQGQSEGLFGNTNQQGQSGGLFGNTNQQGQSGGLFGNKQQGQSGGLFGNNQQGQSGGLFGNNNQQGGLFGNNNNQFSQNNNNMNQNQQIPDTTFFTSVTPVIALNQNNDMKNIQLCKLPDEFQKAVLSLKLNLKNQEIKLDELQRYSQRLIDLIDQNNKSVEKLGEFNNFINQKLNKYDDIINQVKDNFNCISESFEEEQKNIKLMEQDSGYKIEIPSKFLVNYSQNLFNRTCLFQQRLNDIITLIKLNYSQTNNDFNFDCDIMESTIAEFIKIVRYLLEANDRQEKMISEMFKVLLKTCSDYGHNPETVYNNVMQYTIECNSNSN